MTDKYKKITLLQFILHHIRKQGALFAFIALVSLGWSIDHAFFPYILEQVIDVLTRYDADRTYAWQALKTPVLMGALLWLTVELSYRCQGFALTKAIPKFEASVRMEMFDHIQRHSPKYFSTHLAGSLANKITDMVTNTSVLLTQIFTLFLPVFAALILAALLLLKVSPYYSFILVSWVAIHMGTCILFSMRLTELEDAHGEARSHLMGRIVDSFTNNVSVNLFYRFTEENKTLLKDQKIEEETNKNVKNRIETMRIFLGIFTFLGAGVLINWMMIKDWLYGHLTTGEVVFIFNITWNIMQMAWYAGLTIPSFFQSIGIANQALKVMNDPSDLNEKKDAPDIKISAGEIIFDKVFFQYNQNSLFQNKQVHIKSGEKVGLVGYSGAGKSTFVNLILRFYPLNSGRILIDGQDIAKTSLKSLRQQIALIPQDPVLFHRSIYENIEYSKIGAKEEEVYNAAALSFSNEFIEAMPHGYNTIVGERGTRLSGGERQRIAIARAILADAPILILDEATSALDSVTELSIQKSLRSLMKNRTTLVIAHRLSTLLLMDRILVFNKGKIVEEGSHDTLLKKNGLYAKLWKMQAGGFFPDHPKSSPLTY